jgi:hypothetical protein
MRAVERDAPQLSRCELHVFGPPTPSAKTCFDCHARSRFDIGPNRGSAVTLMIFFQRTTSGPDDPRWIVACGPARGDAAAPV